MDSLIFILMIALSVASISFTIAMTGIFEGFRNLISKIHPKIEELIHCPWCLGHYICLGFMCLLYKHTLFLDTYLWLHLILNFFSIMTIVATIHHVLLRTYDPVAKAAIAREFKKIKLK